LTPTRGSFGLRSTAKCSPSVPWSRSPPSSRVASGTGWSTWSSSGSSSAVPAPLPLAHLNGAVIAVAEARVPALDRGFLFADGVYEAIAVYDGRPFRLAEHLSRLARSLRELRIADPHDPPTWRALIEALVAENGGGTMTVYLQVTRGAELARDHAF